MSTTESSADRKKERRKARGVALRVGFYVIGAYLFLLLVGHLGSQAQE